MNFPENLRYTKDHEWVSLNGNIATIGITDFAQDQLGDVVHVDLPRVGENFSAHAHFGEIESVKTFSELFTPVSGEVLEINEALADAPELINSEPYGGGWMIKIKLANASEVDALLNASEYEDFVESQKED